MGINDVTINTILNVYSCTKNELPDAPMMLQVIFLLNSFCKGILIYVSDNRHLDAAPPLARKLFHDQVTLMIQVLWLVGSLVEIIFCRVSHEGQPWRLNESLLKFDIINRERISTLIAIVPASFYLNLEVVSSVWCTPNILWSLSVAKQKKLIKTITSR
jgi:hypothetical protein